MPFESETFYGTVELGDFTLNQQQINALMEPMKSEVLPKEQFEMVMLDPHAWYGSILSSYGLSDF